MHLSLMFLTSLRSTHKKRNLSFQHKFLNPLIKFKVWLIYTHSRFPSNGDQVDPHHRLKSCSMPIGIGGTYCSRSWLAYGKPQHSLNAVKVILWGLWNFCKVGETYVKIMNILGSHKLACCFGSASSRDGSMLEHHTNAAIYIYFAINTFMALRYIFGLS